MGHYSGKCNLIISHAIAVLCTMQCWFLSSQLKCCGLYSFTDYKNIFNNLSVPVSCCNTTHPLVNQSTCPKIVTNYAKLASQTSQIYTKVNVNCITLELSFSQEIIKKSSSSVGMGVSADKVQHSDLQCLTRLHFTQPSLLICVGVKGPIIYSYNE